MKHTIVITGAGSGIGRAIAEELANRNFRILLLGRNIQSLEQTQNLLKGPKSHQCFSCDVRRPEQIRAALEQSGTNFLYGAVVNAGIGSANFYGDNDSWHEQINTNLTGSYNTAQECLPYLKACPAPHKKMIFMSSVLARLGAPSWTAYCASKTGILGLMRAFAAELGPENILVNAICPSWVDTRMAHEAFEGMAIALGITKEEVHKNAMAGAPLGKISNPGDIARLVAFLMEETETSITGQAIDINNGAVMV